MTKKLAVETKTKNKTNGNQVVIMRPSMPLSASNNDCATRFEEIEIELGKDGSLIVKAKVAEE